jgi:hypothetical protein
MVNAYVALGMQPADRILIVGCGLGFTIEVLEGRGYTNVYGLENSGYMNGHADFSSGIVSVDDDLRAGGRVLSKLRQATGDDIFTWVVDEDVLTSYEDSDMATLISAAEAVLDAVSPASNIVHVVTPGPFGDAPFNSHTMAEWKAFAPTHTWLNTENLPGGPV